MGRMWNKASFKRNKADLNSEFSFSGIGYLSVVKEPWLPLYFPITGEE